MHHLKWTTYYTVLHHQRMKLKVSLYFSFRCSIWSFRGSSDCCSFCHFIGCGTWCWSTTQQSLAATQNHTFANRTTSCTWPGGGQIREIQCRFVCTKYRSRYVIKCINYRFRIMEIFLFFLSTFEICSKIFVHFHMWLFTACKKV